MESPEPRSVGVVTAQIPVQQPSRGRVFHVGVESSVAKYLLSQWGGKDVAAVGVVANDAGDSGPMTH